VGLQWVHTCRVFVQAESRKIPLRRMCMCA